MICRRHGQPEGTPDPVLTIVVDHDAEPAGDLVEALAELLIGIAEKRLEREVEADTETNQYKEGEQ